MTADVHSIKKMINESLDQDLVLQGYFDNHPNRQTAMQLPVTPSLNQFMGAIWPMGPLYYNPMNAVYLMQIVDLRLLRIRPEWVVRDGLIPLLWFFKQNPRPPDFNVRLYVDESLARFVPEVWSSKFGTYRLHSGQPSPLGSRTALIGIAAEIYAGVSFVHKKIAAICARESAAGSLSTDLCVLAKIVSHDEKEQTFHASYFREIFTQATGAMRIMTRNELCGTFDMQKVRLYDLNEKLLLSDNSMAHELLRKGAYWGETREISHGEEYRKLSPFHGYVMNANLDQVSGLDVAQSMREFSQFHDRVDDVFSSQAFQHFPWPTWFTEWARATQDEIVQKRQPVGAKKSDAQKAVKKAGKKTTAKLRAKSRR